MPREPIEDHELAAGQVQWHSSEEDGGPDVGIMIGLGDGRALWFGELLNSEGRFGFTVFSPTEKLAVASYDEYDEVRELLEQHIAPALRRPSPVAESTPTDATAVEAEREACAEVVRAAIELGLQAGRLSNALDGQEDYRLQRQTVLNAMKDLSTALDARTPKES